MEANMQSLKKRANEHLEVEMRAEIKLAHVINLYINN
jgi:hypothetical protein